MAPSKTAATSLGPVFKYGMPLYSVTWPQGDVFIVCGGGGSTSSGIKNRVVFAECKNGQLTDQVAEYNFGQDCPMRMTISPDCKSLVFAMGKGGISRLDIDLTSQVPTITPVTGEVLERVTGVTSGEVRCLAFSPSGDHLGLGMVDGGLFVYTWPALTKVMELSGDHKLADGVRDLEFAPSPSSRLLAVTLDNGHAELWNWGDSKLVCKMGLLKGANFRSDRLMMTKNLDTSLAQQIPAEMALAQFTRVRFARGAGTGAQGPAAPSGSSTQDPAAPSAGECPLLYALMNNRSGSYLTTWSLGGDTGLLTLRAWKKLSDQPGACFDLSSDGKSAAVGTSEGAALVASTASLSVVKKVPKAHMVFSTGICFSADGRNVISISADASAHAIPVPAPSRGGGGGGAAGFLKAVIRLIFLALLLLAAAVLAAPQLLEQLGRPELVAPVTEARDSGVALVKEHASKLISKYMGKQDSGPEGRDEL